MSNEGEKGLLTDNGLSDQARVLGLYIRRLGEAPHEIPHETFQKLLHGTPAKKTISRHLRQLEVHGYLERTPGGRGHADRYQIAPRCNGDLTDDSPPSERGSKIDRRNSGDLSEDSPPSERRSKHLAPRSGGDLSDPDEGDIGEEDGGGSAREGPDLHPRAAQLIDEKADALEGCRDTLRDYLDQFVERDRHYFYVQQIIAFLEEIQPNLWKWPNGRPVPPDERAPIIAEGLNKLASGDETSMSRPVGSPDNLETKIEFVIKRRWRQRDSGSGGSDGQQPGGGQKRERRDFSGAVG